MYAGDQALTAHQSHPVLENPDVGDETGIVACYEWLGDGVPVKPGARGVDDATGQTGKPVLEQGHQGPALCGVGVDGGRAARSSSLHGPMMAPSNGFCTGAMRRMVHTPPLAEPERHRT